MAFTVWSKPASPDSANSLAWRNTVSPAIPFLLERAHETGNYLPEQERDNPHLGGRPGEAGFCLGSTANRRGVFYIIYGGGVPGLAKKKNLTISPTTTTTITRLGWRWVLALIRGCALLDKGPAKPPLFLSSRSAFAPDYYSRCAQQFPEFLLDPLRYFPGHRRRVVSSVLHVGQSDSAASRFADGPLRSVLLTVYPQLRLARSRTGPRSYVETPAPSNQYPA